MAAVTRDLIERMRALASLAAGASRGSWEPEVWDDGHCNIVSSDGYTLLDIELDDPYVHASILIKPEDLKLMAAAWDMAALLGELADLLEARANDEDASDT